MEWGTIGQKALEQIGLAGAALFASWHLWKALQAERAARINDLKRIAGLDQEDEDRPPEKRQ